MPNWRRFWRGWGHKVTLALPIIERRKLELKRRVLRVVRSDRITPALQRITLGGPDLAGFDSPAPDDHIKLFFPNGTDAAVMRDYTPRRFDAVRNELTVDFVLHQAGPATEWARNACVGDEIIVGGPRGSKLVSGVTQWLLIGDETALPAIARRIEELGPQHRVTALVSVVDAAEEQDIATAAALQMVWLHRNGSSAADPAPLLHALQALPIADETFVWIAAEAGVARALRQYVLVDRAVPMPWLRASGYWQDGVADGSVKLDEA